MKLLKLLSFAGLVCAAAAETVSRIVAVGDLHGDYQKTIDLLHDAGLIDPQYLKWTGGNTTLVQVVCVEPIHHRYLAMDMLIHSY